ncbi:MAG TPA: DUF1559 domain-containing protein [Pirellulales bacterium]|nr:DUF1559 domain-containing protein [Pirellulales bacterium]
MSMHLDRRGITLTEVLVVLFIIGIAAVFLLLQSCASVSSREAARRMQCLNNLRKIGFALNSYEQAHGRFPLICFNEPPLASPARDCRPGDASGNKATTGYSWIVAILPYMEQNNLYQSIRDKSQNFSLKTGPFDPTIVNAATADQAANRHVSCVPLATLICPSSYMGGEMTIDVGLNPPSGAPEYATIGAGRPGPGADPWKGKVAPTNYKAMVGTHMRDGVPVENGGMLLSGSQGVAINDISDGTSKTMLVAESNESGYASWYDGTLNWLVANDPNAPAPGTNGAPPWKGASKAVNRGFNPAVAGSLPYLKKTLTANSPRNDVWWGPSSEHAGGIVGHLFADIHTVGIADDCDSEIYLGLTTRNGSEPLDDTEPEIPGNTTFTNSN